MIFNNNNVPSAPIDEANADLTQEKEYEIREDIIHVAPGDWVDISESVLTKDQTYGISFQVVRTFDDYITILYDGDNDGVYQETTLSLDWILNNYRRV